jgi:HlyD family secretion protein
MNGKASLNSRASIRRHIIAGCALVAFLAVGLGGWASTAEISGALIAQGSRRCSTRPAESSGRCACATAIG